MRSPPPCDLVREEKISGTSRDGRHELETLLAFLHSGDTLVVTRIDRLARSMKDLQDIVHDLKARNIALKATEHPTDASTAAGGCCRPRRRTHDLRSSAAGRHLQPWLHRVAAGNGADA